MQLLSPLPGRPFRGRVSLRPKLSKASCLVRVVGGRLKSRLPTGSSCFLLTVSSSRRHKLKSACRQSSSDSDSIQWRREKPPLRSLWSAPLIGRRLRDNERVAGRQVSQAASLTGGRRCKHPAPASSNRWWAAGQWSQPLVAAATATTQRSSEQTSPDQVQLALWQGRDLRQGQGLPGRDLNTKQRICRCSSWL